MPDLEDLIAIVGMAVRLPGADHVDSFWNDLTLGREAVTRVEMDELSRRGVPADLLTDSAYVPAVSSLRDPDTFDAGLFRMTPREAQLCDPQIRLFLEVAHSALEDAGRGRPDPEASVGVFAAAGPSRYAELYIRPDAELTRGSAGALIESLNHPDYLATTTSYKLDLRGPSMTVLTACSSSLVALHAACQALRLGDCDVAVVGGANLQLPLGHGYLWSPGGVQSRDGHCAPFDADASGTVFASGAAAIVVRPLADALRDGDHITAVICGSAVNNDGAGKVSFAAPSIAGQVAVVVEAMSVAGVDPAEIAFVEAHGTGTPLGDPIEVAALTEAFRRSATHELPRGSCAIGSVKGNVGHLGAVAGITGLIKAALALERGQLPPSINFTTPNPALDLANTPFRVADTVVPLPRDPDRPRYAGVSSFGVGGTNVHVVLREPPERPLPPAVTAPHLVVWSGRTAQAERAGRAALGQFFSTHDDDAFPGVVGTLQHGRRHHGVRAAAVCADAPDARAALAADERVISPGRTSGSPRPVALVMPGQGAQRTRAAAGLYRVVPRFTEVMDECLDILAGEGLQIRQAWLDGTAETSDTLIAQPLLTAVELALAEMWAAVGPAPRAVLGHSVGELAAAAVAGVFTRPDVLRLVVARSRAMGRAPTGGMLAVAAGEDDIADVLDEDVCLAVVNGPRQVVLSGPLSALDRARERLAARGAAGRMLRTSGAFHHPSLAGAAQEFLETVRSIPASPPRIALYSGATGALVSTDQVQDPTFWAGQIVRPVRFWDAAQALMASGDLLVLDIGPGRDLAALMRTAAQVRAGSVTVVPTLPRDAGDDAVDRASMLAAVGRLWVEGHDVDFAAAGQIPSARRESAPGYPYQRSRFWVDPRSDVSPNPVKPGPAASDMPGEDGESAGAGVADAGQGLSLTEEGAQSPFSVLSWSERPAIGTVDVHSGRLALILLPNDPDRALDLTLAVQQAGYRTVRVRPGSEYAIVGDEFRVRPGVAAHIDRVLDVLAGRGDHPDLLVHATAAAPWEPTSTPTVDDQLQRSFMSFLALVQRGLRTRVDGRQPRLVLVTTGAVDVSGSDDVEPIKASLPAAARTLALELPWLAVRTIDVSASTPTRVLSDELDRDQPDLVALRNRRRWIRHERPLHVEPTASTVLRREGVYVITGGLGGLGLAVALGLAGTGQRPSIALLGRTGVPDDAELGRLREAGDVRATRVGEALDDIRAMGARVRVIRCDVAEPRDIRRALDVVTGLYGSPNGVLHLAGVPGDGMLQARQAERATQVFHPKVNGLAALEEALAGRPALDFLTLFSSRSAIDGLVGSGDYAAANAVLDLAAEAGSPVAERILSIGWPSWSEVGMAAAGLDDPVVRAGVPATSRARAGRDSAPQEEPAPDGTVRWETTISGAETWVLAEHVLDGVPVLPGTGHLDLVLRAFAEVAPATGAQADAVVLSDVVFTAPLSAPSPRRVRIVLTEAGARSAFTVASRPASDPVASWSQHAQGWVERTSVPGRTVDVAAVRARMEPAVPPNVDGDGRMFHLGPRWRSITAMAVRDSERVIDLQLPAEFHADLESHPVHPALLDCATAAVRDADEEFHLPFLYRRMTVHDRLPGTVSAVARRVSSSSGLIVADVDLVDASGRVSVAVEGFTMRRIDAAAFSAQLPGSASATGMGAAEGVPHGEPAVSERTGRPGIPPHLGVTMLLDLLGSQTPGHVLVRPHVDGRPVALPADSAFADDPVGEDPTAPPSVAGAGAGPRVPSPTAPPGQPDAAAIAGPDVNTLRDLWRQVLGIEEIGEDEDFFDLGGNSLSAVELMSRIRDAFGRELSIAILFDAPTLAELAQVIQRQTGEH